MTDYPLELQVVTYRHKIQTMKYLTQHCKGAKLSALFTPSAMHGSRQQNIYSETSNSGPSEKWTTSVQRTKPVPLIAIPIEIIHWEPLRTGHLSTRDNRQPAAPKGQLPVKDYLQEWMDTETAGKIVTIRPIFRHLSLR